MIKALFVITNLTTGGIQTQVLLLAKYLQNQLKFDVTIWGIHSIQKDYIEILQAEKIKYVYRKDIDFIFSPDYFQQSRITQIKAWKKLIKNLKREKFDIVFPFGKADLIFNIAKLFTNFKLIFSFQRGGHPSPSKRQFDFYHWMAKISSPVYVANSYHGRKALSIIENIPEKKIHVIRNAYVHKPSIGNTENWEYQFNTLFKSRIVVTMVSNFFDGKDHKTVIHAWNRIEYSNALLVFAGLGGPKVCHKNFEEAKELVKSLNLQSKILFLGSIKNTSKLLNYTDIGILSSLSEGCPNAILEYMGHKLPVIGTDIPGIREILPEENKKFLFPFGDIAKCSEMLYTLIKNKDLRLSLGKINKQYVCSEFAPEKMYNSYKKIFIEKKILI